MPKKGSGNQTRMSKKELAFVESYIEYCLSKESASEKTQAKKRQYAYTLISVLHDMKKDLFTAAYEDFSKVPGRLKNQKGGAVTQNTRQSYVSQLKAMVGYLENSHDIKGKKTAFTDIRAGTPTKQNKDVLSPEEWQAVLNAPMSAKERAYVGMLYDGYHRPTEPLTLKWSDLKINSGGAIQYKITFKTGIPREIVQKPDATALLEAWRRECGHNYGDDAFIFPATGGRMYTSRGFTADLFAKISKHIGNMIEPSSIRNTAISHDIMNELPLQYICLRAWGEPFNPMINIYVNANSAKLQAEVQAQANGGQPVKIEHMKPRELKTLKKCPACGKDNAVTGGGFCVYCGSNMDGSKLSKFAEQEEKINSLTKKLDLLMQRYESDITFRGMPGETRTPDESIAAWKKAGYTVDISDDGKELHLLKK